MAIRDKRNCFRFALIYHLSKEVVVEREEASLTVR